MGGAGKRRERGQPRVRLEAKSQLEPDVTGKPWKVNYTSEFIQMQGKGEGLPAIVSLVIRSKRT